MYGTPSNIGHVRRLLRLAPVDVAKALSDATDDEIRNYEENLRKLKSRASTDLQQNVYQNRTQFIKISKEAEKLKGEMRALKNLMSDLKTNTTALRSASSRSSEDSPTMIGDSFSTGLSKRDKRSSVADRTALWNSQMQVRSPYLGNRPCSHLLTS